MSGKIYNYFKKLVEIPPCRKMASAQPQVLSPLVPGAKRKREGEEEEIKLLGEKDSPSLKRLLVDESAVDGSEGSDKENDDGQDLELGDLRTTVNILEDDEETQAVTAKEDEVKKNENDKTKVEVDQKQKELQDKYTNAEELEE